MTPYGGQLATGFNSYEPDYYPTSQSQIPFYFGQMTKVLAPNVPSRVGGSLLITPTYYASSVNSSYNAFQFELRKRYSKGIQLGSGFTWSHSIDTASDFVDSAGSYALPQDSSGGYEKGDSSFDVRLREAVYFVWDPSAYWERAHGWRLTGIGTIQTGLPFTVNTTVDVNNDGNLTDRLNSTNPAYLLVRPPGHDDPTVLQLTGASSAASLLAQRSSCRAAVVFGSRRKCRVQHISGERILQFKRCANEGLSNAPVDSRSIQGRGVQQFESPQFGIPVRILEFPSFGRAVNTTVPARIHPVRLESSILREALKAPGGPNDRAGIDHA